MARRGRTGAWWGLLAVGTVGLAACTGGGGGKVAGGSAGTATKPTLTVFAPQNADDNRATSAFTTNVERELGIDITWQTTTYDSTLAKQERLESLASGNPPDVYLLISWVNQFSSAELTDFGGKGLIVPLNDLIDKYAPHVKQAFADTPAWKKIATAPDGKIYGLPQWNDCFHCSYPDKLWMNSAWLHKLGLRQPRTPEDLRKVLEAFKTRDPNGNGKADEIPLTGVYDADEGSLVPYLMDAFGYDPGPSRPDTAPLTLANGKVQFQPAQDSYRKGLEYIASLYAEGLIDKAAFTQNYSALKAEGDAAGATLVGAVATLHPATLVSTGREDGRDRQYDAVPPLTGPAGVHYATYTQPSSPGGMFVITSKATEAERVAAVKLLDYLVSTQGHLQGEFGKEGTSWVRPAPGDLALDSTLKPLFKSVPTAADGKRPNDAWGSLAQYYSPASFRNAQVQPVDIYSPAGYERRLFQATKLYQGKEPKDQIFPSWNIWLDKPTSDEVAPLQAALQKYVANSRLEFITGAKKLDVASWSAYLDDLRGLGLQRYLDLMQKAYDGIR